MEEIILNSTDIINTTINFKSETARLKKLLSLLKKCLVFSSVIESIESLNKPQGRKIADFRSPLSNLLCFIKCFIHARKLSVLGSAGNVHFSHRRILICVFMRKREISFGGNYKIYLALVYFTFH